MRKVLVCLVLVLGACWEVAGQGGAATRQMVFPRGATVVAKEIEVDYHPLLVRLEAPFPDGNSEKAWLAAQKAEFAERYRSPVPGAERVDSTAASPWKGDNFATNHVINGVPNDNDMAISNGGKIVSVINSNLYMHDEYGATLLANVSLDAFSTGLGLNGDKFDPRALYDPLHDRYIIACLNGFTSSTSFVIVGFSQTNDPTGAWNLYALPGDPNGDTLWTDYPIMALTADELFITGNLLYNNQPWQTGFNQSICWQIDLDNAYAGDSLDTRLWYNVQFGGAPIRNLCPVQGGSGPAGPNLYLLSNRNFSLGNDTVFIMEITDTLNAPGVQLMVDYGISNTQYRLAPDALQQFNQELATNDARWLDGFIENGNIQFVGNCGDSTTGRAAFYHGLIDDITGARVVTGELISNPAGDYGYPAIAWMGMSPGDNDALLAINFTGTTAATRAGCGAIYFDGQGGYSPMVVAKTGDSYINAISGTDRWGDYTGIQRRYNENGVVWMAGTFGKSNRQPGTWISEYHHPGIVGAEPSTMVAVEAVAYPNPSEGMVALEFSLETDAFLEICLWDGQGKLVRTLVRDLVRAGKNRFHFSTAPLAAGIYYLRVMEEGRVLTEKKIVRVK